MTSPTRLMTAEEFGELPEREDGCREELVGGLIEWSPPPTDGHGDIQFNISDVLRPFVRAYKLGRVVGEAGFRVARDPDHVPGPDASFLSFGRESELKRVGAYLDGAPDLVIEIISPSDRAHRVEAKVRAYLAGGARRVWLLYPDTESVTVHRDDGTARMFVGDELLTSDDAAFAVEGFSAPASAFFD